MLLSRLVAMFSSPRETLEKVTLKPSWKDMKALTIRIGLILLMSATIGCDRVTKHIAATTISGTAGRSFLADTVRLQYAENPGAFLSLGEDWPPRAR